MPVPPMSPRCLAGSRWVVLRLLRCEPPRCYEAAGRWPGLRSQQRHALHALHDPACLHPKRQRYAQNSLAIYLRSPSFPITAEHDFCGLRCSKAFRTGKEKPASCRASPVPTTLSLCKLPACQRLAYVGPTGEPSEYCGNAHRLSVLPAGCICLPALNPYVFSEAARTGAAEKCLRYLTHARRASVTD